MTRKIHLLVAVLATLTIAVFFTGTVVVELFGSPDAVASVKRLIVVPGLFILVPAIAATGGTGFALSKRRTGRLVDAKRGRMPIIAATACWCLCRARSCSIFGRRRARSTRRSMSCKGWSWSPARLTYFSWVSTCGTGSD